jgi:hypothetical protein
MEAEAMYFLELVLEYAVVNVSVFAPITKEGESEEDVLNRIIPLASNKFMDYYGMELEKFVIDASYECEEL